MNNIETFATDVLEFQREDILDALANKECFSYRIPKKDGYRKITSIDNQSNLYLIQKNLASYLATAAFPKPVKGFIKGSNYVDFLSDHIGNKWYVRIDIKNFFDSLEKEFVIEALKDFFIAEGYSFLNSESITKLCWDIVSHEEKIPQGFPTSPVISNIVFKRIDQRIYKYCSKIDVKYTRYADDLLFSSDSLCFKNESWFLRKIKYILKSINLQLNYNKIKFGEKELSLNGFVVSIEGVRISRKRIKNIRRVLYYIDQEKFLLNNSEKVFLEAVNSDLIDYDIYEFKGLEALTDYLAGYRSFLIMWYDLTNPDLNFNMKISKLILRIEKTILDLFIYQ